MDAAKLLPIGSVVTVKDAEKQMMVIGILQKSGSKEYDYMATLYPEGFLDAKHVYMFNHADIQEISFLGYMDSQYQVFRNNLAEILRQGKN